MSDEPSSPAPSTVQINIKGPSELKLQIDISTDKTVRELKQAVADKSQVEADRQRLIYSGRVLKDEDALSTYKIQSGHTVHMVKGAARAAGSSSTSTGTASASQPLPSMQTGQNVHDPLSQLNSHQLFGHNLGNFNPFGEMGVNTNDPNMMTNMLNSPEFLQQMSSVMSNPQVIDQIIASNPQLQAMGPHVREMFQNEQFRRMISNPESLRNMIQMSSMMQRAGLGPPGLGGAFGGGQQSFPAPGAHSGAPAAPNASDMTSTPGVGVGTGLGAGANPGGIPSLDPNVLAQLLGGFGGGNGGGGAGGAFNPFLGAGLAPSPPVNLPPAEERFQVQLQQLQDMGFTNASQNVRALLATGGNVHSAIEYILNGGGL